MGPQKRTLEESESLLTDVRALIVDIEGTTTPIEFVKEQLFPYITDNIETFLANHFDEAETQKDIAALRDLATADKEASKEGAVEIPASDTSKDDIIKAVIENVKWQMSSDRKSTELKQFQGHMWQEAYKSGAVKGELYEDVADVLRQLHEDGNISIYVYSSGSIESQKLLFQNSTEGDLTEVFSGYFDTTTGPKTESASYKKISEEIGVPVDDILFLTDRPEEAAAAFSAGVRSTLVIRDGNEELGDDYLQTYSCIESFSELFGEEDDEDDLKRLNTGDNGDAELDDEDDEDDDDDVVDEEDEENEDSEGEGDS